MLMDSIPLEVLRVQLSWDAQHAVVYGRDVRQLLLLRLPGDVRLPQAVRAKICAGSHHRMIVGTIEDIKTI